LNKPVSLISFNKLYNAFKISSVVNGLIFLGPFILNYFNCNCLVNFDNLLLEKLAGHYFYKHLYDILGIVLSPFTVCLYLFNKY